MSKDFYSQDQNEIVSSFMKGMEKIFAENPGRLPGYELLGLDVRSTDKYRLLFEPKSRPDDRLLIYNRARKADEIHFLYVPDFSFHTGNATDRKKNFRDCIKANSERVEAIFGLPLFSRGNRQQDHLQITSQAWKGFSKVYWRPLERWVQPDFTELMAKEFIDFTKKLAPLLDECLAE